MTTGTTTPRPAAGRRERAKADKRARILAAAQELFRERGYEGTSMSEVARSADVAAGTVFQYAVTKTELLMMVTASLWPELARRSSAAAAVREGAGDEDVILALIGPFLEMVRRYPEQTTWVAREMLFGDQGPHRADVLRCVEELEARIAGHLGAARASDAAAGPDGPAAPDAAPGRDAVLGARLLVTGVLAEVNRTRQGRAEEGELSERVRRIVRLVAAGVASPSV